MTETSHTRSRRASLFGLLLQLVVFAGVLVLSQVAHSVAAIVLAWYTAGGVLIWFVALLVFRQRELAALEALDLEELRREKREAGGGEAIFDQEGGGALGFRAAETRLRWMQRWLIPAFGLLLAIFLAGGGLYHWFQLRSIGAKVWLEPEYLPLVMIALAVAMLLFFLFSRYASGMGRVAEWQLLRACGSYMLGNALGMLAVIICLGIYLYAQVEMAERVLAYVFCGVMVVLAGETLFSFVLDIYRPRMPDAEPRACFDSRLLSLISEPGGIASTIAEAMNYQFGFEVSQTWFYQLLQRTLVPLAGAGAVILWLLTGMLVVQPGERAIIERWGRQLNASSAYEPGFYWKLPWPIDVAHKYDTGRLHQINVGFKQFDAEADYHDSKMVALWTDERHFGQPHFDFVIPVPPLKEGEARGQFGPALIVAEGADVAGQALPVNIVRMDVAVQYKINEDELDLYTRSASNPHDAIINIAWEEIVRYTATSDIFSLLGEHYGTAGANLKDGMNRRLNQNKLGLEVIYVGVQNVHPEPGVAKEFRKVVTAEQEKIASIRQALVRENEVLSAVAGDRTAAKLLAHAIDNISPNRIAQDQAELVLRDADPAQVETFRTRFAALTPRFSETLVARWQLDRARDAETQIQLDFEQGLGRDVAERAEATERVRLAESELATVAAALDKACVPVERDALAVLKDAGVVAALRRQTEATVALAFWNGRLEELLPGLQGAAAAILAQAQAERWKLELGAAAEVARVRGERDAYQASPQVYKLRKYLAVLVTGIRDSRKFFLAFDPGDRQVRVRYIAEEQARPDMADFPSRLER